ncbi:methionyl-tRNA formyltransferase [Criibacterium bergeronii]|uniref:Methionyl-tRNA formyltransferase n=1 Tax=Criibacterium bergeronii TaxID=1871336 RepID=A0A371IJB7_9FIRM|nr:methionyl-tRNA formyltransferase [Criibacterium bergeronii]RDY20578.1 methionyl-tRNA formyltransferase [Criibacterium bergeronii]
MRAIFMGTPAFAVHSLDTLINKGVEVVLVITQEDKKQGRKMKLEMSDVKKRALELNLEVYQPHRVRSEESVQKIKALAPDLIVETAYGQYIPKEIIDIPKYGIINVHPSLLPKYRGATPINQAILNGDTVTGVTTMQVDEGMDTGDIILSDEIEIDATDTAQTLSEKLAVLSEKTLGNTINMLHLGIPLNAKPQDDSLATNTTLITKEMGHIDYTKSADEIINHIRGYQPWPCAYSFLNDKSLKIYSAVSTGIKSKQAPGTVVSSDKALIVSTGTNDIIINELQLAGKNRMNTSDFLRGNKIEIGTVLK